MGKIGAALRVGAVAVALLPVATRAQMETREGIALQNQILELRRDVQDLQSQLASGAGIPPADYNRAPPPRGGGGGGGDTQLTAQLLARVQTLEDQVRSLRGRIDELQNQSGQQQQALAKQLGDLSFQMQQGGGRGGGAPPSSPGPATGYLQPPGGGGGAPPPAPPAAPVRRTPELAMQEGNAALARRDYNTAESAAREVLNGGRGPRAYDAQFLLAQAQAGQRNYQAAAVAYDDTFNRNPAGSRAQDSLVGLAGALLSLGDRGAACGALDKLRAQFPSLRGDVRESAAGLRGRAGCR